MKKKSKKKNEGYSDLKKYPTRELYNLLRKPPQFKHYIKRRKISTITTIVLLIIGAFAFISILLLAAFQKTPAITVSLIALAVSLMSLITNLINTDLNRIDANTKEEIKAEIEYRKYMKIK